MSSSYRSRSGARGADDYANGSGSGSGYYPRSDSGYVRDDHSSRSAPGAGYDRGGSYSSSRQQAPRHHPSDRAARDDLFQGSGYDPQTRRAQGYVPPADRARAPAPPAPHEYRRHADQDQGYFYSQADEEHAYRQVRDEIEVVKDQSVDTSRSALRRIRETEEMAAGSMRRLQEQGDKLTQVESRMTDADYHANRAENKTQELQRLNKNFIASSFTFSNPFTKAKRKEEKLRKEVDERKRVENEHEEQRKAQRENTRHMGSALDTAQGRHVPGQYGAGPGAAPVAGGSRSRAHYLEGEEDCDKEREIDNNLDEISGGLARLKMMGVAMGESIERSNQQIDRIDRRTDTVNDRVKRTEAKLGRMR